jgi:hypothetical protein
MWKVIQVNKIFNCLHQFHAHFFIVTSLHGCNVATSMRQTMLQHILQTSCTGVSAVLLLRLSGLGCPFKIHSFHISLAMLHDAPHAAYLRCGSCLTWINLNFSVKNK